MLEVIEFFKTEEVIVVFIVVAVAIFAYFLIHYIDKFCRKRKQRQNTKELYRLVEDINIQLQKEQEESGEFIEEESTCEPVYVEPVIEKITPNVSNYEEEQKENQQIFMEIKKELEEIKNCSVSEDVLYKEENINNEYVQETMNFNNITESEQEDVVIENIDEVSENVIIEDINSNSNVVTDEKDKYSSSDFEFSKSAQDELIDNYFNNSAVNYYNDDNLVSNELSIDNINDNIKRIEEENTYIEEEILDVDDDLSYTDSTLNVTEAQEELRKLTEALENASTSNNIDLTSYEEQQEKDAIISLDELIEKTKDKYDNNELSLFDDETEAPISLDDLEKRVDASLEATLVDFKDGSEVIKEEFESSFADYELKKDEDYSIEPEILASETLSNSTNLYNSKLEASPIISPIYGINENELELENTANYEKLDEEIKKTNEFLAALKELKSNL